jgi:CheY-like chemotaxis protein/tetratricopeptide (TPR) repeat protein
MTGEKILIIEDDLQIRTMMERYLASKGHPVVVAGDGLQGIRAFSRERPDVVVVDMLLPRLQGTDVCDMIKRSVEGERVPVVMLCAGVSSQNLESDLRGKLRPDAFLVKPFQSSELLRVISTVLDGRVPEDPAADLEVLEIRDNGKRAVFGLAEAGLGPESAVGPPPQPLPAPEPRTGPPARAPAAGTTPPPVAASTGALGSALQSVLDDLSWEAVGRVVDPAASLAQAPTAEPGELANPTAAMDAAAPEGPGQAPGPRPPAPGAAVGPEAQALSGPAAPSSLRAQELPPASAPLPWEPPPSLAAAPARSEAGGRVIARAVAAETVSPGGAHLGEFDDFLSDLKRSISDEDLDFVPLGAGEAGRRAGEAGRRAEEAGRRAEEPPPVSAGPAPQAPVVSAVAPPLPETSGTADRRPAVPLGATEEGALGVIHPRTPGPGLGRTSFPELLFLLYRKSFSGLLTLTREGGQKQIFFLNGFPVHVQSSFRAENLGRSLVRMGRISEDAYLACLRYMEEKRCGPAEALVETGLVSAHELPPILRALQRENLLHCFTWDNAVYEIRRGADLVARVPVFEMDPLSVIAEGLLSRSSAEWLSNEFLSCVDRYVRPSGDLARYYPQLSFHLPVSDLDSLIDGTRRVGDLVERFMENWVDLLASLRILLVLKMVELSDTPTSAAAATPEPAVAWPGGEAPATAVVDPDLEEKVLRTYLQMKSQNYFDLLGVGIGAREEEIERAYLDRAQVFHPDRLQHLSSTEVRDKGKEVFSAITQAYEVLRDPVRRAKYLDSLAAEPQVATGLAAAEEEFRKGERFLQQEKWANAQACFIQALRLNPKEPEYYLQLGWVMYQNYRTAGNEAAVTRAVNFLRQALGMNPQDDRAFYYLGRIYQDRGQEEVARQLFLRALKHNPQNEMARHALSTLAARPLA